MVNPCDDFVNNIKREFDGSETIHIIDCYSVLNISKGNYVKDFANSLAQIYCLKTIKIYMCRNYNENEKCLYVFLTDPNRIKDNQKKIKAIKRNYSNMLIFAKELVEKGINCEYIIYKQTGLEPNIRTKKIHGRYWLNEKSGLIVDGSINTSNDSVVLAQRMDKDNYDIIKDILDTIICQRELIKVDLNDLRNYYDEAINMIQ